MSLSNALNKSISEERKDQLARCVLRMQDYEIYYEVCQKTEAIHDISSPIFWRFRYLL